MLRYTMRKLVGEMNERRVRLCYRPPMFACLAGFVEAPRDRDRLLFEETFCCG